MEGPRWEALRPGGLRFVYGNGQHPPGLDSFLLASLPRLKPGWKVCDLGCGTGLLGLLLLQRQRALAVTGLDIQPEAVRLGKLAAAENRMEDRLFFRRCRTACCLEVVQKTDRGDIIPELFFCAYGGGSIIGNAEVPAFFGMGGDLFLRGILFRFNLQ